MIILFAPRLFKYGNYHCPCLIADTLYQPTLGTYIRFSAPMTWRKRTGRSPLGNLPAKYTAILFSQASLYCSLFMSFILLLMLSNYFFRSYYFFRNY